MRSHVVPYILVVALLTAMMPPAAVAADKVKITGYVTARPDATTIKILDDVIALAPSTRLSWEGNGVNRPMQASELEVGVLIEAEGVWTGKHKFLAEKITGDSEVITKVIKEKAYLAHLPMEAQKITEGGSARLKVDGEVLVIGRQTHRKWAAVPAKPATAEVRPAAATESKPDLPEAARFLAYRVEYEGVRQPDGIIAAQSVELSQPAPPDAYKIPENISVVRGQDAKTKTDLLEMRKGDKILGRLKLFPVPEVQKYVRELGHSLLPAGEDATSTGIEFRFWVVEDASINASAFPDGTILVHTGLLGAVQNEAQLAAVLSHEIAHVLQAHYWRNVHETRAKRVLITIAAIAGAGFVGDISLFLGQIGLAAVVNGYSRRLEDQADRIALQNMIELGYDPREAPAFERLIIDRYSMRSSSAVFSSHNSPLLRGSFLSVQIERQYPGKSGGKVNTEAFKTMKEVMGPVKVL